MNSWHKRFMYLQIVLLLVTAIMIQFTPEKEYYISGGIFLFLILQIAIQGTKGFENPDAVYYRKSCVMALIDFFSMFVFTVLISFKIYSDLSGDLFWINPIVLILLFIYIAFRKYYIIKNYSYEK